MARNGKISKSGTQTPVRGGAEDVSKEVFMKAVIKKVRSYPAFRSSKKMKMDESAPATPPERAQGEESMPRSMSVDYGAKLEELLTLVQQLSARVETSVSSSAPDPRSYKTLGKEPYWPALLLRVVWDKRRDYQISSSQLHELRIILPPPKHDKSSCLVKEKVAIDAHLRARHAIACMEKGFRESTGRRKRHLAMSGIVLRTIKTYLSQLGPDIIEHCSRCATLIVVV
jgi:hypothetical protein